MDLSCKIDVSFYRPETKPYLRAQKMFQDVELWSLENRLRHRSKIMPGNVSSLAMRFLSLFRGGQSFSYLYPYLPIKNWNISVLSRKTERRLICLLIDSLLLKTGHLLTTSIHHNRRHVRILGAADWYLTTSCFLAVQDSSIGDLVSESLIKWLLISACREQCKESHFDFIEHYMTTKTETVRERPSRH